MTAVEPRTFMVGALRCHTLEAGSQRLDGGAMFGVVPKPLWERRIPADERNRIPLALRCLLVEHPDGLVLIDTGVGNKETEKFVDLYGIDNVAEPGPTKLEGAVRAVGHEPDDIAWVVNTHLHFDHAGGNTVRMPSGEIVPAFHNATYVVQRGELEFARLQNERIAASYLPRNFEPITERDQWRLVEGEVDLLPGVRLLPTPGHVPYHQSILLESGGEAVLYLGDLVPTVAHLPLAWIMGYDLEPLRTLETKRAVLERAVEKEWLVIFEHDPTTPLGRTCHDGKAFALVKQEVTS